MFTIDPEHVLLLSTGFLCGVLVCGFIAGLAFRSKAADGQDA